MYQRSTWLAYQDLEWCIWHGHVSSSSCSVPDTVTIPATAASVNWSYHSGIWIVVGTFPTTALLHRVKTLDDVGQMTAVPDVHLGNQSCHGGPTTAILIGGSHAGPWFHSAT